MTGRDIFRSVFFRNVFTLTAGTAIAQIIPVLLQPLLRRIYTPEEYGVFATYLSVTNILIVISSMRYETAVVLPKKDDDARNLVHLGLFISLIINGLLYILVWVFHPQIMNLLDIPEHFGFVVFLIPVGVLLFAGYQNLNYWLIRKKAFRASSLNKIVRRGTEGMAQLGLTQVNTTSGLFFGDIIGKTLLNLTAWWQIRQKGFRFEIDVAGIKKMAIKYSHFPSYYAGPSLLDTASLMLPIIFINRFYTPSITGQVDLTLQVLAIPLALISAAVAQVLYQQISEKKNSGRPIFFNILRILLILAGLAGVALVIILLFAPPLFAIVFGAEWETSGRFSQILIFGYAARFMVSPLSMVITALEKLRRIAIWQGIYFTGICCLLLAEGWEIQSFLRLWMTIDLIAYTLFLGLILYTAREYDQKLR